MGLSQRRKISPKTEVFGRTSLRTSGQKLRSGPPNPGKQAFWHGHAARTSTKKLRSEKLRADFSFDGPFCLRRNGRFANNVSLRRIGLAHARIVSKRAKMSFKVKNAPTCYRALRWPDLEFPRKIPKTPKFWTPRVYPQNTPKIAKKYPQNTKRAILGIVSVSSGVFSWGSRISAWGVFCQYFSWQFRVGPSWGSPCRKETDQVSFPIPEKSPSRVLKTKVGQHPCPKCNFLGCAGCGPVLMHPFLSAVFSRVSA